MDVARTSVHEPGEDLMEEADDVGVADNRFERRRIDSELVTVPVRKRGRGLDERLHRRLYSLADEPIR